MAYKIISAKRGHRTWLEKRSFKTKKQAQKRLIKLIKTTPVKKGELTIVKYNKRIVKSSL